MRSSRLASAVLLGAPVGTLGLFVLVAGLGENVLSLVAVLG